MESYEILKFYLVMSSNSEIFQDTLSVRKFKFWHEILGVHPKKLYLSHSGKWMQNGYSLSHSSTFTWTTPGKSSNLYGFTGVVQVNVLEWLKEKSTCIHLPEWLKYNFFGSTRSARIWLATIRLPNAGPTTGLKSAKSRLYERRLLADFRPVVGPAFGSRMVAKRFCADRVVSEGSNLLFQTTGALINNEK